MTRQSASSDNSQQAVEDSHWHMVKETVQKEDGRYLIYYRFVSTTNQVEPTSLKPSSSDLAAPTNQAIKE
jgi:hypothetical protein